MRSASSRRCALVFLDRRAVGGHQPPHATDALPVGLSGCGIVGEVVQRPIADPEHRTVGVLHDAEERRVEPSASGGTLSLGTNSGGHAAAQSSTHVGSPVASLAKT